MFEKEAEEWVKENMDCCKTDNSVNQPIPYFDEEERCCAKSAFKSGAEFGYNKGKEDVKYDLMMKLKDEGIVTPLKDSIFYNQRLSSQEQQELCSWIECAMDFGESLDEAVERIEKLETAILKLRNCMNCKHRDTSCHPSCKDKGIVLCSHWEVKE